MREDAASRLLTTIMLEPATPRRRTQSGNTAVKLTSINCCGNASRVTCAIVLTHWGNRYRMRPCEPTPPLQTLNPCRSRTALLPPRARVRRRNRLGLSRRSRRSSASEVPCSTCRSGAPNRQGRRTDEVTVIIVAHLASQVDCVSRRDETSTRKSKARTPRWTAFC